MAHFESAFRHEAKLVAKIVHFSFRRVFTSMLQRFSVFTSSDMS